jgi:murein DD-endopeptidase MepM/ murein hydrolase activator NlpD
LREVRPKSAEGVGRLGAFTLVVLLAVFLLVLVKAASRQGPAIRLVNPVKGLGQSTPLEIEVRDAEHGIRKVTVEVRQGGKSLVVVPQVTRSERAPHPWWQFWKSALPSSLTLSARAGRREIPELQEGRATLVITAVNDSWGRLFRGGQSTLTLELPVRFTPPRLEVLTSQHYINQGGCDMVVFKVSPGTVESGVQVGRYFFPSWPVQSSQPDTRLAIFAYPYDLDPSTPARLVARDDAGNETVSNFNYRVFPKKFRTDTINLTDEFMNRVVPPILSQTPDLADQGSLLKNFLEVNGPLRARQAQQLIELSHKTAPEFLWKEPFIQLGNSKVEASFADYRTYTYNGQVVDRQVHLGYDLAVTQHTPVVAANDGVVIYAAYFGIYGNAVIIDHGCGLQTLYGHLSSIGVKVGDRVKRGQTIGRSGQTGLAGGDHLHFTVLLDGIPVNPTEWWDPHWIHDRIQAKLAALRTP